MVSGALRTRLVRALLTGVLVLAPVGAGAQEPAPTPVATPVAANADSSFAANAGTSATSIVGTVRVRPEDGGGALPHAMVTVRDGRGFMRMVLTDSLGSYRMEDVPPGTVQVRAIHIGYEESSLELTVPAGGAVGLEMELSRRPLQLRGIVVQGDRSLSPAADGRDGSAAEIVPSALRLRLLEISPGLVESGIGQGDSPGGPPSDPGNVLLMRGSTADLNLVLLDGAAVYAPFHLGGLLPGFEPGIFARAEHHTGGAPARYDGGLSYILDLRTRPARRDAVHADVGVDALSARGTLEAPLGDRAGVLFAGRALHNAVGPTLFGGDGSPYGYRDALLRVDASVGRSIFGVTAFSNRESVILDLPDGVDPEDTGGGRGLRAGEVGDASWGNEALAGSWHVAVGEYDLEVTGARSRYEAGLPTRSAAQPTGNGVQQDSLTVIASGRTDRTRLTIDAARATGAGALQFGLAYDRMEVAYRSRPSHPFGPSGALDASGTVVGGYLEGIRPLTDAVDLEYGLRLDHFRPGGFRAAPRLTLLWTLGPAARLTLTGGRYHQLTRRAEIDAELGTSPGAENGTGAAATLTEGGALLQVATADHLVASLEQSLGETVHLTTELFLKDFRDVPGVASRRFTSSGVDLQVLHRKDERTVWLGYSLAWFWEPEEEPGNFSGRHLLSAGLNTPLIGPTGASFRVSFSDGLPLTSIRFDGPESGVTRPSAASTVPNGFGESRVAAGRPVDGFLRLDAEIFAAWTTMRAGREVRIRPYLRVLNALDRRDALFHYFEPWREESLRPLVGVPLLPVLGLELRF